MLWCLIVTVHDCGVMLAAPSPGLFPEGGSTSGLSSHLERKSISMAQVPVWIEPGVMRLPPEGTPMIMVGPGTGVAPFRAMLEERGLQMQQGAIGEACTWACNSQGHSSLMGSFPAVRTVLHSAAQLLVVTCRALATCHFLLGMLMS